MSALRIAGLANTGSIFQTGLQVRVVGDLVHAWVPTGSRSSPPHFHGRVDTGSRQPYIRGTVREAWMEANLPRLWWGLTVWMVLIAVFGIVTLAHGDRVGLAPLLIGIFGGVGFAGLAAVSSSQRGSWFDDKYEELDDELTRWAATSS
ncbi:hypothetical protein [Allobranchiibius huperziae]|uniref:Uncharacterized protein n=1 Tax=Allobranchiibius huperziae TaxID=1874116 RepID=A0A853DBV9_9MICO|nr:hypothetical protein [Allobranchiibius huperziae]NYJ74087.1 hypothetical protein [Allobranchiibius huperziae]